MNETTKQENDLLQELTNPNWAMLLRGTVASPSRKVVRYDVAGEDSVDPWIPHLSPRSIT